MLEHYLMIKNAHIGVAYTTVLLFLLRGLYRLVWQQAANPLVKKVTDRASYLVDTLLLMLAFALLFVLKLNPLTTPWLASKLMWLLVYVGLGVMAFRQGLPLAARWLCFLLALGCWWLMYQTARQHAAIWQWPAFYWGA